MKNWLVTFVSVFLVYVLLEVFCLDIFFRYLSHGAYPLLDEGIIYALQPTKRKVMPENYVAILGDSYAMGLGDAYYDTSRQALAEYGSAPYLHRTLDRDVISWGTAGNSSISAMVTQPVLVMKFFNQGWRTSLEAPADILVYFYEGNDFSDNVEYPHYNRKRVKFHYKKMEDPDYLQTYIEEVAIRTHPWNERIERMRWYDQLYLANFSFRAGLVLGMGVAERMRSDAPSVDAVHSPLNVPGRHGWIDPGIHNRVRVKGEDIQIPDKLQGPSSLGLTEKEKMLSLRSFSAALHYLKKAFPQATVRVVYLPSVLSSYTIQSRQVHAQNYRREEGLVYTAAEVSAESDWGAQHIRQLAEAEGVLFVDARPHIRAASQQHLVHGPKDWNHFNQEGYRALADAILPSFQPAAVK